MLTLVRPALAMMLVMTALTGIAYPLAVTGIGGALNPSGATGSVILQDGRAVGSALISQGFSDPGYLHPRPSAVDHATLPSGASNFGPTSALLAEQVAARRAAWEAANGSPAPADALTASGSGLDPHVSPENARGQAGRIAAARGMAEGEVLRIIAARTEGRWLGLYGERRVNVLLVNLDLDAVARIAPAAGS
ncbi:potassium-transporting ATPase subunit KdpC [Haematobacter missouriensis]|uniref:Potassium-transporting ATPase KdpC subunit n=1 Tax=Haematobacter missouriensis TaxID=366616 RepID=A0A212AIE8_9RHOB|nr:potassium-transporting ATPase subunit KdpC [Haematobacter missouriensis]OWJ77822.1 potassium-transporting ATPase subunit C [Haematobacter missouriensis]OWJ81186.1 potassium-transporting ATPase subunit C [Haematobacter missouriensis]